MNLLFVDSNNRDTTLYPDGNNYVIYLTTIIRNIKRVELVSARVPNTMYNLTNGTNVIHFSNTSVTSDISLNPGFYTTYNLASSVTSNALVTLDYLPVEGHFIFSGPSQFNITVQTQEMATMLGLALNVTLPTSQATSLDPNYTGKWILKSSTLIDMSVNDYIFLDIAEFKTPSHVDTGSMSSNTGTIKTSTVNTAFAPVIMDIPSATIKNFHENQDYKISVEYPEPINSLDRLTIRWIDSKGNLLNFQGWNTNALILRLYTAEPLQEVMLVDEKPLVEKPARPTKQKRFHWWFIVLAILGTLVIWKSLPRRSTN